MENGESFKINHNSNLPYIPDHPFRILIIDGSGSGKSNVYLLNLLKYQWSDIDKIYLYVKDPFTSKYQLLINGRRKIGMKKFKNPKVFIDYSQITNDDNIYWLIIFMNIVRI